ncbi:hypothetical protein D3C81_735100 [compost metagenome]
MDTDEGGQAALTQGAPVVFLGDPAHLAAGGVIVAGQRLLDQVAKQAGNGQGILQPRAAIADTQLDRRKPPRGPDRPPEVTVLGQATGTLQQCPVALVGTPVRQRLWQPHVRPFPAHCAAIAHVAGILTAPIRRRSTERQQQGQPVQHPIDHPHPINAHRYADVHVQAIQQAAPGHQLVIVEQLAIVRGATWALTQPLGAGVARRAVQPRSLVGQRLGQALSPLAKELTRLVQRVENRRSDLYLAMEHFFGEPRAQRVPTTAGHGC